MRERFARLADAHRLSDELEADVEESRLALQVLSEEVERLTAVRDELLSEQAQLNAAIEAEAAAAGFEVVDDGEGDA